MTGLRSSLFSRKQPGGVFTIVDIDQHPGDVWFVDSEHSAASDTVGFGQSPDSPFATLNYAISLCAASNGDVIYVMPGHAEEITTAGGVTLDVIGVTVIGLGKGDARPTFTFADSAAASIAVEAADCYLGNCIFICNITSQNHMIDLTADDFTIEDCFFREGTQTGLSFITADGNNGDSDLFEIRRCLFYSPTDGNYSAAIEAGKDFYKWLIEDNDFYGSFDEAAIDFSATADASVMLRIYNNHITNLIGGEHAIQISGTGVTGWATGNMLQTNAQGTAFDSAALSCHNNTWVDTDGAQDEEAVPANAQHATTTALVGLQADAITAAVVSDDAPLIQVAISSAFAMDAGTVNPVFTIAGGPIQLLGLFMAMTEAVNTEACACSWTFDPAVPAGADTNELSTTFDITDALIGTVFYLTGVHDVAMAPAVLGTEAAPFFELPLFLPEGVVFWDAANSTPTSGISDVYFVYRPLVAGVTITVA